MKKNIQYVVLLLVFISAAGFVVLKFKGDEKQKLAATYTLLERKGGAKQTAEWINARNSVNRLTNALKADPADSKSMIALANLYILEARATGNYTYYDKAAMKYVDAVLERDQNNFDALTLKALIFLSQHHFAEGLAIAQQAEKINPYNAFLYGILVDGHVEMGNYDSAVMSAEKMMAIRPDLRSYSRASYLREIHGDYPGAIEAMQLAIDAGLPGDEATEWSRVQLGQLYEHVGDVVSAAECYEMSLSVRPAYVHALAGQARIALAEKKYSKANLLYQEADSLGGDFTLKEELINTYRLAGQEEKALALSKTMISAMAQNAAEANKDNSIGHYADKELALAYLEVGEYQKALDHALAEYNRRPKNIEVNETLAWVYYLKGENPKSISFINAALKTNSLNPVLMSRAGLIFQKAGQQEKARMYFEKALKDDALMPVNLKTAAMNALNQGVNAKKPVW